MIEWQLGYSLLKKHNVHTTAQLIEIKDHLENELKKVTNLTESIAEKEKISQEYFDEALKLAKIISTKRQNEIKPFEEKVNKLLTKVGMPNAKIKVEIKETEILNSFGNNTIEFLFNANLSSSNKQFELLRKVASGGELSRLMLEHKIVGCKKCSITNFNF